MKKISFPKSIVGQIGILAVLCLVLSGAVLGIVWLVRSGEVRSVSDTLFMVGLVLGMVGLMACMKGAPNVFGWLAGRTTRPHSSKHPSEYCDTYKDNSVVEFRFWRMLPLLTGVLLMVCAVLVFPSAK